MAEYAKILIEKEALPSVRESLQVGRRMLTSKLEAYTKKIQAFEREQGMDTDTFLSLFDKGELGDRKEWFKWEHAAHVVKLLTKKLHDLDTLKYEA